MALWRNKTGLAKATAILATVLLVSIGLCGANVFLTVFVPLSGPAPQPGRPPIPMWRFWLWLIAGQLELAGIAVGAVGLVVVALIAALRALRGDRQRGLE